MSNFVVRNILNLGFQNLFTGTEKIKALTAGRACNCVKKHIAYMNQMKSSSSRFELSMI